MIEVRVGVKVNYANLPIPLMIFKPLGKRENF